jgi:hypothetical protein
MAEAKSRSRGSGSGRTAPSSTKRTSNTRASRTTSSKGSGGARAAKPRSSSRSRNSSSTPRTRARAGSSTSSSNGVVENMKGTAGTAAHVAGEAGKFAVKNIAVPAAAAVAGTAAGIVLGQRRLKARKKVLGVPIPGTSASGVDGLARQIGETGKQFSKLAGELRKTREKAEEVGKAIS